MVQLKARAHDDMNCASPFLCHTTTPHPSGTLQKRLGVRGGGGGRGLLKPYVTEVESRVNGRYVVGGDIRVRKGGWGVKHENLALAFQALEDDTDRLLDLISKAEAIKPTRSEGTGRHGDIQWDNVAGTSSPVFPPSPRQHSDEPPQGHAQTQDPNLQFTDELEAYHTFPGVKANFTPAPISVTTTKPESGPSQTTPLTTPFTKQPLQDAMSQLLELFEQ